LHVKFQTSQCLDAGNHPDQRNVRQAGIGIAATHIGMRTAEPGLLDVAPLIFTFWNRPEGRHEWPAAFIEGDGMQPNINVVAEASVMEPQEEKSDIPR